jgi:hypothetical protein
LKVTFFPKIDALLSARVIGDSKVKRYVLMESEDISHNMRDRKSLFIVVIDVN